MNALRLGQLRQNYCGDRYILGGTWSDFLRVFPLSDDFCLFCRSCLGKVSVTHHLLGLPSKGSISRRLDILRLIIHLNQFQRVYSLNIRSQINAALCCLKILALAGTTNLSLGLLWLIIKINGVISSSYDSLFWSWNLRSKRVVHLWRDVHGKISG